MITYSEFLRIRRQEQEDSRTITKLTDEMLEEMKEYIAINKNSLDEAKKLGDEHRIDEINTQIKNAISTLEQILNARMLKIASLAILNVDSEQAKMNMLSKERILFDNFLRLSKEHKSSIINEIKSIEPKKLQKVESDDNDREKVVIKVISDIPKFVWRNDKSYGPFTFPNIIEIDKDVADILIKSGKAESA
jgi:DNA replication initiation complex subunit (GINS family)